MKNSIFLLLSVWAFTSFADTIRLSEPVYVDQHFETFGKRIDSALPEVSLASLIQEPERHVSQQFRVSTAVTKVCQKKGCFFIAQSNNDIIRVAFKDYGFFVPTDIAGKSVELAGTLIAKQRSDESAAHFNQDLGSKGETLSSGLVYEILADGVKVPLSVSE